MIGEALYEYLSGEPAVAAIVDNRIWPVSRGQHANGEPTSLPCLVYAIRNIDRQKLFCGTGALVETSLQLDAYSASYYTTQELAAATIAALIDYRGYWGAVWIESVDISNEFDMYEAEPGLFRYAMIFAVFNKEG
jgi:hypothetical protein